MSETPPSPESVAARESQGSGVSALTPSARAQWMRQVNHVRKQEFAYLRSVQKRQAGEVAASTLAGLPAPAPRAGKMRGDTLKKIDEIEAQLDLLWVSSRHQRSDSNGDVGIAGTGTDKPFPASLFASPSVLTHMMHHSELPASVLLVQTLESHTTKSAAASEAWMDRRAVTLSQGTRAHAPVPQDAVLIQAAELFADAQYALAAQHLARSLRGRETSAGHALQRLLALLDIYRATGNQAQFDWSVLEYFDFWEGNTPQWQRRASADRDDSASRGSVSAAPRFENRGKSRPSRKWRCPSVLDRVAADEFQAHWTQGGHCTMDWTSLSTIEVDAAAQLTQVFNTSHGAPEQLRFVDTPNLLYVLEQATPIGNSEVSRHLWLLRFGLLTVMGMHAAFDAACTDFCLTFIEPAPAWNPGSLEFSGDALATAPVASAPAGDSLWYLHGHVLGETGLNLAEPVPGRILVDCATMVRMDASATQHLLQWLQKAQVCGSEVHFSDVGLLPGALWKSAGVDTLAEIHLRDAP